MVARSSDSTMGNSEREGPVKIAQSAIEQLPDELKRMILSRVSNIRSLLSAILSCPSLYFSFRAAEQSVVTAVFLKHMDPDIAADAIAEYESRSLNTITWRPVGYNKAREFIISYCCKQKLVEQKRWRLSSALNIANFHRLVERYTREFVLESGAWFPGPELSPSRSRKQITPSETLRIQRALYRYEIFCNIFKAEPRDFSYCEPWHKRMCLEDQFLAYFSPWENEQLACVYDFLIRKTRPAFNDLARHDIEWGSKKVGWEDSDYPCGFLAYFLSSGLERADKLTQASTYERRMKLWTSTRPTRSGPTIQYVIPASNHGFLGRALGRINGFREREDAPADDCLGILDSDILLCEFTPEEEALCVQKPHYDDVDAGPETIWRWAHDQIWAKRFVGYRKQESKWGYVMWDLARIEGLGLMTTEACRPTFEPWAETECRRNREKALREASWKARSEIFAKGGRGWWSEEDQSRIVWTEVKKMPLR